MKNFLQSTQVSRNSIKELSHLIYRIEAHIYRGELGPASALLAAIQEDVQRTKESLSFPIATVIVGSQLGFLSGGALRGRLPGAVVGAALGWLYGQNVAAHRKADLEVIESRIEDLRLLLSVQARRLAEQ